VQGYFVYAFCVPVLLAGVLLGPRDTPGAKTRWRDVARWCTGFALGVAGYVLGYALIAREEGGLAEFSAYLTEQQRSLGVFTSPMTLAERALFVRYRVVETFGNGWHHSLVFGEDDYRLPGTTARLLLLLAGPPALLALAEWQRKATPLQRLVVALPASFCLFALIFGGRTGSHHFMPLLPIGYAGLALGFATIAGPAPHLRSPASFARLAAPATFALLVALNLLGHREEMSKLVATRGVGLYSDAINRLAADLAASPRRPYVVMPDWGLALPTVFLTGGRVHTAWNTRPTDAKRLLCEGRDVAVALIEGDRVARRDAWRAEMGWDAPSVTPYRQADGAVVFELVTFEGRIGHVACDAVGPAAR
jgi:hypothetical protein